MKGLEWQVDELI